MRHPSLGREALGYRIRTGVLLLAYSSLHGVSFLYARLFFDRAEDCQFASPLHIPLSASSTILFS